VSDVVPGRDAVLAAVRDGGRVILELRSGEEYRGERVAPASAPLDHGAERKGRGAVRCLSWVAHDRVPRCRGWPPSRSPRRFAVGGSDP
jgi:hypothetical protein